MPSPERSMQSACPPQLGLGSGAVTPLHALLGPKKLRNNQEKLFYSTRNCARKLDIKTSIKELKMVNASNKKANHDALLALAMLIPALLLFVFFALGGLWGAAFGFSIAWVLAFGLARGFTKIIN